MLSIDQAATLIGVSKKTLYNYSDYGILKPKEKVNGRSRYDIEEVLKIAKNRMTKNNHMASKDASGHKVMV